MSLTHQEAMKVVNRYIGMVGGYLGDFPYRTHAEFYRKYCDLDIRTPDAMKGRACALRSVPGGCWGCHVRRIMGGPYQIPTML